MAFDAHSLGLSISDGKQVMRALQQEVAAAQANEIGLLHRVCQRCHRWNPVKDYQLVADVKAPCLTLGLRNIQADAVNIS